MNSEKKIMSIIQEDGSIDEVEILVTFEFTDTKKAYVIYTKNETEERKMSRMTKRVFALLLSMIMVLSIVPFGTLTASAVPDYSSVLNEIKKVHFDQKPKPRQKDIRKLSHTFSEGNVGSNIDLKMERVKKSLTKSITKIECIFDPNNPIKTELVQKMKQLK